jgi:hypothetical protein
MEELDNLLSELLNKPEPQPQKAEVSSFKEEKTHPPEKPTPQEPERIDEEEIVQEKNCDDLVYKEVPSTHVSLRCQSCQSDMEPGEKHWYYNDNDRVYWWCTTCGWEHCNLEPPQE